MKSRKDKRGYLIINLSYNHTPITKKIHRLVAETYLGYKSSKLTVNHKDGNKTNNNLYNLEWCSDLKNKSHARKMNLYSTKKVICLDTKKIYNSLREASVDCNISPHHISSCCNGKLLSTKGTHWMYYENYATNGAQYIQSKREKKIYCKTNGKLYQSLTEASVELKLDVSGIAKVCKGKYKSTKGHVFQYYGG